MTTLYLIPTPIAENATHTLPTYIKDIVCQLDLFIVERAKTARHFVKACGHPRPISELEFVELSDNHNSLEAAAAFEQALSTGRQVGLLSEAGCPGVADPGAAIVALAHRRQARVKPLVGPSSILLALMASGMNGQQFTFHGYLPPKRPELGVALKKLEQQARQSRQTQLFIETPYRCQMVLEVALSSLQGNTLFGIAQDITGAAESIRVMTVDQWKKIKIEPLEKLPAVFMIEGAGR